MFGYDECPHLANWRPRVSSETSGLRHGMQLQCGCIIFLIRGNTNNHRRGASRRDGWETTVQFMSRGNLSNNPRHSLGCVHLMDYCALFITVIAFNCCIKIPTSTGSFPGCCGQTIGLPCTILCYIEKIKTVISLLSVRPFLDFIFLFFIWLSFPWFFLSSSYLLFLQPISPPTWGFYVCLPTQSPFNKGRYSQSLGRAPDSLRGPAFLSLHFDAEWEREPALLNNKLLL